MKRPSGHASVEEHPKGSGLYRVRARVGKKRPVLGKNLSRVARAIASAESDALARLARLESDLEEIAARLGYMPLDSEPRTAYELLRLNVDKLERDLQHEIAEHQRHHDMESQMGPLLFHLHEAARLWREYRRTDTEWDWGPVTAWHEQDAQLNPELAVKK